MRGPCRPSFLSPPHRSARPLHSLSVLAFDQERLERKVSAPPLGLVGQDCGVCRLKQGPLSPLCTPLPQILALRQARRPVPPEVAQQYQDIMHRSQWQRAQLEQGGPGIRRGGGSGTGTRGRGSGSGPILTPFHPQNTWPSWSISCSSTQRLLGA